MKNIFTLCICCLLLNGLTAFSQNNKCGTMNNFFQLSQNSQYLNSYKEAEKKAKEWKDANQQKSKAGNVIYIPVVFHCIYKNTNDVTYLHDSIFDRQIAVLNETFSLTNQNFSTTRSIFDSIAVDTEIRFCLAGQDTLGNSTNGIMRYQSNQNWLSSVANDAIKTAYPPWNPNKYLNVWTCDMSLFGIPVVLGYAAFPGGPPSKDGVVLQAEFVGYQNNGTENNLGRTMVHEVGHWLGLRHIWGDGQNSSSPCDSTDYVDDTPHASDASQTDCDTTKNTCSNESSYWSQLGIDPPDMVENYMDYSKDGCMTMFTKGQKDRMWSFLNTIRSGLLNNPASCNLVGTYQEQYDFNEVVLFPNPTNRFLEIQLTGAFNNLMTMEIFDTQGRSVHKIQTLEHNLSIDLNAFQSGIYTLKISHDTNYMVKKFIKE